MLTLLAFVLPMRSNDDGSEVSPALEDALLEFLDSQQRDLVQAEPEDATVPSPTTTVPATTAASPAPATEISKVQLHVSHYCFCVGPRDQAQVKVKLTVTNGTDQPLSLDTNLFRIVVPAPLQGTWSPPRAADEPIVIDPAGENVIAIVANPDGAAERLDGAWTFATHWPGGSLDPGMTYFDEGVKEGDLVFYVPTTSGSVRILGIAYVNGDGQLLGIAPIQEWVTEADPNTF